MKLDKVYFRLNVGKIVVILCSIMALDAMADSITPKIYDKTIGNWGHAWWRWALQYPAETNPIATDGNVDCLAGQQGKVWFLAGTFGAKANRTCTVKKGRSLFFPIFNGFFWVPEDCPNELECRKGVAKQIDTLTNWTCTIDNVPCIFKNQLVRDQSDAIPLNIKPGTILEDFGYAPGLRKIAIADGYWMMLKPLSSGQHVLHFTAAAEGGFKLDVTYHLTVSGLDY